MQHLCYGMSSFLKFAVARHLPLARHLNPFIAGGNIFAKNRGYLTASVHSFATCVAHVYSSDVTSRCVYIHPFNGPFSGTTRVSRYQKGKTNLDFTEAKDSEWQWHQLGCMQVCISLQTDNHASTSPLIFLRAGCPSCRPTNSIKALKAQLADVFR